MMCAWERGRLTALKRRALSFLYAFHGWAHVLRTQPNTWIHALATVLVMGMAWWLALSRLEWALLIVAVTLVWMGEFFNTALEAAVDLAAPEQHPLARVAKDVAAAAVLVAALGAAAVGLLVLGPPLWERLFA
jgi:diacylglycerol kinase